MRTALIAAVLAGIFVMPSFAADNGNNRQGSGGPGGPGGPGGQGGPGQHYEQKKAEILKRIDQRIARIQEEKACVQASKSHIEIKACRDKFRAEMQADHPDRKQ